MWIIDAVCVDAMEKLLDILFECRFSCVVWQNSYPDILLAGDGLWENLGSWIQFYGSMQEKKLG